MAEPEKNSSGKKVRVCARCGEPIVPLSNTVLEKAYGTPLPADVEELNQLCPKCRKKVSGENLKKGLTGQEKSG